MAIWPRFPTGVYSIGIVRRYGTDCTVQKFFNPSNRFICRELVGGEVHPKDRYDHFKETTYRTHYGYNFAHNGVIYRESPGNLRYALRRLMGTRMPDGCNDNRTATAYERNLRASQINYIDTNRSVLLSFRNDFNIPDLPHDKLEEAIELAHIPHPKRKLRALALKEIDDHGQAGDYWSSSVWWKMKLDEYAKPGKYPRVIVDLGVAASLEAAAWIERAKKSIADKILRYNGWVYVFCGTPEPDLVMKYMDMIWHNRLDADGYHLVFSDDSVIATYVDGDWRVFNADISTCDASHTSSLFAFLMDFFDAPESVRDVLNKQVMADIRVGVKKAPPVFMRPRGFYLQSGSVMTTLINTIAQLVMFSCLCSRTYNVEADIIRAAADTGYVITLERCILYEDIQFLKMSPTRSISGSYHACLNLGVILRASGTCRGDVPKFRKRRCLEVDALHFQHNLMSGMLNRIYHEHLNLLSPYGVDRSEYKLKIAQEYVNAIRYMTAGPCIAYNDDIYRRYRLTTSEIAELNYFFANTKYGDVAYGTSIDKILSKDYGLSCPLKD